MRRIPILLVSLLAAWSAQAQLSLDECRRLAREHYPAIRQYDLVRQTAEYSLSNARRAYLPQFSFAAQATWQNAVSDYPAPLKQMLSSQGFEISGMKKDQYKLSLELSQTIWDGGKTGADKQLAQAEAAEGVRAADVDLYAVEGRVDELFFGVLLLDERIAQIRVTLELLQSNFDRIRAYQRNGVATQSDADAVEAGLLTVNQELTQAVASRESYRRMLEIFIGCKTGEEPLVRPDIVEPPTGARMIAEPTLALRCRDMGRQGTHFSNFGSEALSERENPVFDASARPEQALFDAKIDVLAAQQSLVRSSTRPRFGLFAQGYYGYPGLNFMQDMLTSSWSWNALVGVKMSWNFGAYYTRKNSLSKLRVAQQSVEVQRDIFLFNNRLQFEQESGEIVRLRRALSDDDRIVVLRRSVREAAESQLRNGVIDTTDLLGKITDEASAAMARSAREIELLKAIYELKHTINR